MIYGRKGIGNQFLVSLESPGEILFLEMVSFHWKPDFRKPHEVRLGCQQLGEQHYFLVKIQIFEKNISSMGKKDRDV